MPKQTITMLIIDKKRMPIKESGLPQMVIDQTPKLMRRSKLPIVKAKIGPKIMSLVADESIYDLIPVKKEVKAEVSGIYILNVRGLRGALHPTAKEKRLVQTSEGKGSEVIQSLSPLYSLFPICSYTFTASVTMESLSEQISICLCCNQHIFSPVYLCKAGKAQACCVCISSLSAQNFSTCHFHGIQVLI